MSNQLRKGIKTLRQHYIQKLVEGGIYKASDLSLHSLTLSDLEKIFKKEFSPKNKS